MREVLHKIALWIFGCGIIAGGVFMISMIGYFAIVVAPYFFHRGDYVPAILVSIITAILVGGVLAAVTSDEDSRK